jgi:hypothetical protein
MKPSSALERASTSVSVKGDWAKIRRSFSWFSSRLKMQALRYLIEKGFYR